MTTAQMPLESANSPQSLVLHVLCPSIPQPNRFTLRDLPLSTTVGNLKARLSQSIPTRPPPESQRLFYLGKPLVNDDLTLQAVLDLANGLEFSMHLVLPPAPPSLAPTSTKPSTECAPLPQNPLYTSHFAANSVVQGQQLRYRGPAPLSEADIGMALRRNVDTLRRQLDMQEQNGSSAQPSSHDATTGIPSNVQTNNPVSPLSQTSWQRMASSLPPSSPFMLGSSAPMTSTTAPFAMSSSLGSSIRNPNAGSLPAEEVRARLQLLRQHITSAEEQLSRGIAPPMDHIILLRTQLFSLLDDQYRKPLAERDGSIETLLTRVFNLYTRSDQLRATHSRFPTLQAGSAGPQNQAQGAASLYLLSSPSGYQALVTSSNVADAMRGALGTGQIPGTVFPNSGVQQPNGQPNGEAAVLENVVRQAVLNQQPEEDGQLGLARNIRRLWLFVRLYFFCYMFSEPGTWTRIVYVGLALLAAVLSETSIPRQLYEMILAPVQRHLEGLVHFNPEHLGPPRPQGTEAAGSEGTPNQPAGLRDGRGANVGGVRHNLRRVERSVALFIASLVPGVGERHIEVRNAAEAARNAERAREEEERRRQQEAVATEEHTRQEDNATTNRPEANEQNNTEHEPHTTIPQADNN
ncbi:hypothetical protein ARAM_006773 [Aspergillus rambellii]|uniref:Ubiquitin-like domain-containing protein n=1 Tax=Aspergillus rambellii TaxID=308745 RepID=A0A0F8WPK9_9EURO|nr:hypothetical protein ARAM_006773 [Aspergillus rambellii]